MKYVYYIALKHYIRTEGDDRPTLAASMYIFIILQYNILPMMYFVKGITGNHNLAFIVIPINILLSLLYIRFCLNSLTYIDLESKYSKYRISNHESLLVLFFFIASICLMAVLTIIANSITY